MANFPAKLIDVPGFLFATADPTPAELVDVPGFLFATADPTPAQLLGDDGGGPCPQPTYLMGWYDLDCVVPYPLRSWIATVPDPTGLQYSGTKCGATPIADAFVQREIPPP